MPKTIGQLAKDLNISVETIRYYERRHLIQQPPKPDQGYRHYSEDIGQRIHFIKRAQSLGFTLEEIKHLLSLDEKPCQEVQVLTQNKLALIESKIKDLHQLQASLQSLLQQCQDNSDREHCPVIESLKP